MPAASMSSSSASRRRLKSCFGPSPPRRRAKSEGESMLRLFVGIALPPEQKLGLSLISSGLPGAKWVDPGNYHLTLRFIGETSENGAADIDAALAGIRARMFSLALAGVGHFGTRMLWAGIEKNPALMQLHAKVETALIR